MNNDLTMPRHLCPKCGKPYKWIMTEEPIYQLVVFHFRCLDCGTTDIISLSERQFYETLWDMERKQKGGAE